MQHVYHIHMFHQFLQNQCFSWYLLVLLKYNVNYAQAHFAELGLIHLERKKLRCQQRKALRFSLCGHYVLARLQNELTFCEATAKFPSTEHL